jgi:hypothetical protein
MMIGSSSGVVWFTQLSGPGAFPWFLSRWYDDRFKLGRGLVHAAKRSGRVSVVSLALVALGTRLRWRAVIENRRDEARRDPRQISTEWSVVK